MRCCPTLHVRGPCNERVAVPEPDRFSIPLRHLPLMCRANMNLANEIVRHSSQQLHLVRRDYDLNSTNRELCVPTAQPFRITKGRHPLGRVADGFVVVDLSHTLLILGREQRNHRCCLHISVHPLRSGRLGWSGHRRRSSPCSAAAPTESAGAVIPAIPIWQSLARVLCRTTRCLCFGQ